MLHVILRVSPSLPLLTKDTRDRRDEARQHRAAGQGRRVIQYLHRRGRLEDLDDARLRPRDPYQPHPRPSHICTFWSISFARSLDETTSATRSGITWPHDDATAAGVTRPAWMNAKSGARTVSGLRAIRKPVPAANVSPR